MILRIALSAVLLGVLVVVDLQGTQRVVEFAARELVENPDGDRARTVMLLELPSGREIPVNYLREGDRVYAAADGRWWRELDGEGFTVTVLVRGERLHGRARAVRDDPEYTKRIFAKLRPNAVEGFGRLIEIQLDAID